MKVIELTQAIKAANKKRFAKYGQTEVIFGFCNYIVLPIQLHIIFIISFSIIIGTGLPEY